MPAQYKPPQSEGKENINSIAWRFQSGHFGLTASFRFGGEIAIRLPQRPCLIYG
jgi:hypothetical protein